MIGGGQRIILDWTLYNFGFRFQNGHSKILTYDFFDTHLCTVFCVVLILPTIHAQLDCSNNQAYICDNFEVYDRGMLLGPQSADWTTRSGMEGGQEDGEISIQHAASGSKSLKITGAAGGGPQDVLLLCELIDCQVKRQDCLVRAIY